MERHARWVPFVAGTLVLIGLVGLYFIEIRDNSIGRFEEARLRGWPEPLLVTFRAWPWFLGLGVGLNLLFNTSTAVGHWYRVLDQLVYSPLALYDKVETGIAKRELPDRSISRPMLRQRGLMSPRRKHLRIARAEYRFDLYAAQFGRSLGVAWRCYRKTPPLERVLLSVPVLNWVIYALFFRHTTFHEDQGLFFQESVHTCVASAVQAALHGAELAPLAADDLRPIHAQMLKRWR